MRSIAFVEGFARNPHLVAAGMDHAIAIFKYGGMAAPENQIAAPTLLSIYRQAQSLSLHV